MTSTCSHLQVVYEVDDPNRPRFTLMELKDILQERNSLKARVSDLEDELELYRPNTTRDSDSEDSCDRPVQGPLPYEPEDAPWKKSEVSGIRKFFKRVFGTSLTEETRAIDQDPENTAGTRSSKWANAAKKLSGVNLSMVMMSDVC